MEIPFHVGYLTGRENTYISEAMQNRHLSGDGDFTKRCEQWLEKQIGCSRSLLVPSCTAALEMAAILIDTKPGDEIIMPSFTFVSTANAFVLRGGIPVFVDIRPDTQNIDENLIESAITPKTKAIVVVHYGGVACEMNHIMQIAERHGLVVIEDAAQALMATYNGRQLGSIGHLSAFSFHATKNIGCGEGGALCINDTKYIERAEIIREKGTNRKRFLNGQVDKYTWIDIGSSFLMNEITAAFLYAQLLEAKSITARRLDIWNEYHSTLNKCISPEVTLPTIPAGCEHNAHIFYMIMPSYKIKVNVMSYCKKHGVGTVSHYIPLHLADGGIKFGRGMSNMLNTLQTSNQILRLPIWLDMSNNQQDFVIKTVLDALKAYITDKSGVDLMYMVEK